MLIYSFVLFYWFYGMTVGQHYVNEINGVQKRSFPNFAIEQETKPTHDSVTVTK